MEILKEICIFHIVWVNTETKSKGNHSKYEK